MLHKLTEQIIIRFRLDKGDRKKKYGYFEGILSIVINLLLFLVKFIFGTIINSVSLLADALHSLSDVITSAIIIFGFRVSSKPADEEHPFGHGRVERIVSIVIACMLIVVGFEFFINGLHRIRYPVPIEVNVFIIAFLMLTIIVKELLSHISLNLGAKIGSLSLRADAWHHRTDAVSTVLVVIGFIFYRFGFYYVDGIIGMIISTFIVYTGIIIIKESSSVLIGKAPSKAFMKRIREIALGCEGISDVHHIHVHDYEGSVEITIHIRLHGDTTLAEAHKKASEVEASLRREIKDVEVTVHTEPEYMKKSGS